MVFLDVERFAAGGCTLMTSTSSSDIIKVVFWVFLGSLLSSASISTSSTEFFDAEASLWIKDVGFRFF